MARHFNPALTELIKEDGGFGMLVYVLITIIAVVAAPISAFPLLPIATNLWGIRVATLLSVAGWTLGAMIAFLLARRFGAPLVSKLAPLEKWRRFEKHLPQRNLFWSVVYLRMILPVDVLSYLLGLFSTISWSHYFFATLLGVTPFAFIFSYAGTLEPRVQLALATIGFLLLITLHLKRWK